MWEAVENGDAKEVVEVIRQRPDFNVNMEQDGIGTTLLHLACENRLRSPMIPLLLAFPDIDVNLKTRYGCTPFYFACFGQTSCVREMLKDSRVNLNVPDKNRHPPLWYAAYYGHLDVIKWCIASGREMDLGKPGDGDTDTIGVAKTYRNSDMATLLERFKSDAAQTRHAMRVELGWYEKLAAEMFALVVFVSDGLLHITTARPPLLQPGSSISPHSFLWNYKWGCAFARWDQARKSSQATRARWRSRN